MHATYIQLLLSTIHIKRDLIKYVSARYITQEKENVSWKSCPKIPNSKWQHPCWLACFSIKLGYTSDKERWPTSILMTCFTCVWVNECVWEREKTMERGSEKNHWEKKRKWVSLAVPGPGFVQKGSFGLQTLHCIIAEESGRDSGLKRGLLDRHFRECCRLLEETTNDRTTITFGWWGILLNHRFYNAFQWLISHRFVMWRRNRKICVFREGGNARNTDARATWTNPHWHPEDCLRNAACVSYFNTPANLGVIKLNSWKTT